MGSVPRAMISGSSAAAILGLSEWTTPFMAWQRIMESRHPGFSAERGYAPLEKVDNAAVRWGIAFEDSVVMLTEQATGERIRWREKEFFGDGDMMSKEWYEGAIASCHIDGIIGDGAWLYEGKTTMERAWRLKWGTPGTDRIPQSYACQVQHNMMLTGAEHCTVGVLVFPKAPQDWEDMGYEVIETWEANDAERKGPSTWFIRKKDTIVAISTCSRWARVLNDMGYFHLYEIEANKDTQASMREFYTEWWQKHVIEQTEPDPSNWEDIRRMFTAPVGTIVADAQMAAWANEYKDIRKEIGASGPLKKRQDQLKTLLIDRCRRMNPTIEDESQEKMIVMSQDGKRLASFDGKTFR